MSVEGQKLILSICIPTYNNSLDLIKVIDRISNDARDYLADYEIVVCDNNSDTKHQEILKDFSAPNFKISFNQVNVGFGVNLHNTLRMALGEFILLLGDDDIPAPGQISELIQYLKKACTRKVLFLPIEDTPNPKESPHFLVSWIAMRSGSMMGIVIPNLKSEIKKVNFVNVIYPQIELVLRVYFVVGFHNFISERNIIAGKGLPLIDRFSDKMNRSFDYGVAERIHIIYRLRGEKLINFGDYWRSLDSLLCWAISIFIQLYSYDRSFAWNYVKAIFLNTPNRIFILLILIVHFSKTNLRKLYFLRLWKK